MPGPTTRSDLVHRELGRWDSICPDCKLEQCMVGTGRGRCTGPFGRGCFGQGLLASGWHDLCSKCAVAVNECQMKGCQKKATELIWPNKSRTRPYRAVFCRQSDDSGTDYPFKDFARRSVRLIIRDAEQHLEKALWKDEMIAVKLWHIVDLLGRSDFDRICSYSTIVWKSPDNEMVKVSDS